MKPRNLKNALENGYIINKIDYKGEKKIRVRVEQRFYNKREWPLYMFFWIDRNYFKRTPPIYQFTLSQNLFCN